jgi:hypothetical protein
MCKYEDIQLYSFGISLNRKIGTGTPSNTFCWLRNTSGSDVDNHKPFSTLQARADGWYAFGTVAPVEVACIPLDCFHSNGGSYDVRWASETFSVESPDASGGTCGIASTGLWWGDAAAVMQGIFGTGAVASVKDVAKTGQPNNPIDTALLTNADCNDDGVGRKARASSLFVGIPGGDHRPVFGSPLAARAKGLNNAGEYASRSWDTTRSTDMRYLDEGICYLGSVAGDLVTGGDYASIYPVYKSAEARWQWRLLTKKASSGNNSTYGVKATARCYLYDQSQ